MLPIKKTVNTADPSQLPSSFGTRKSTEHQNTPNAERATQALKTNTVGRLLTIEDRPKQPRHTQQPIRKAESRMESNKMDRYCEQMSLRPH